MAPIHSRLKEIREERGFYAADLAASCGVRRQTIYAIEGGSYIPNTAIAIRLARALDTSVEELFALETEKHVSKLETAELLDNSSMSAHEKQLVHVCERKGRLVVLPVQPSSNFLRPVNGVIERRCGRRIAIRMPDSALSRPDRIVIAGCDPALGESRCRGVSLA